MRTLGLGTVRPAALTVLLVAASPLWARTIVITDEECERMAFISADHPRLSWVAREIEPGVFTTRYDMPLGRGRAFLICYPLSKIPKGQRIVRAELVVPLYTDLGEQRLQVRRVVGDWGAGVCHEYRRVRPKKESWAKPGARDAVADARPSVSVRVRAGTKEQVVNVTEDVELWYTGAAPNQGWLILPEFDDGQISCVSPLSDFPLGYGRWKLSITYEPE
jgi:hypothetical protein